MRHDPTLIQSLAVISPPQLEAYESSASYAGHQSTLTSTETSVHTNVRVGIEGSKVASVYSVFAYIRDQLPLQIA